MKHKTILLILLFAVVPLSGINAQTEKDSLAFIAADWNWVQLGKGAEAGYAQIDMFGSTQSISVVKFPSGNFVTGILHSPGKEASTTDSLAMDVHASFAINGSYFNVKTLYPHTFFVYGKKIVGESAEKELYRSNGVIAFEKKRGEMEIFPCDTAMYDVYLKKYHTALASGPLLILDGKTCSFMQEKSFYETRHPRSLVGKDDSGYYYFVVIDGRFPGQGDGATIPETAAIARYFGMTDAINVDGGGSSTLWTESEGILNHPYDNRKFDHEGARTVPNIIYAK